MSYSSSSPQCESNRGRTWPNSIFGALLLLVLAPVLVSAQQQPIQQPNFQPGVAPQNFQPQNLPQQFGNAAQMAEQAIQQQLNAAQNMQLPPAQGLPAPNFQQAVTNPATWSQSQPGQANQFAQPPAAQSSINGPAGFPPASPNVASQQPPSQPFAGELFNPGSSANSAGALNAPGTATPATVLAESTPEPAANAQPIDTADEPSEIDFSDPEKASKAFGQKSEAAVKDIQTKFWKAVGGDRQAQIDLAMKYVLPIVAIIGVLIIASWLGHRAQNFVTRVVSHQVDETLGQFAGRMTRFAIFAIAIMGVLGSFGVETASFAAIVAALGFAIGMALQGTLGNFAAGIALLIFRPFNVGDYILVAGEQGIVRAISLFTTTIDTADNRHIIMPNDRVFGNTIENWSHNSERRVDVLVGVSYTADMKHTRQVLTNAMTGIPGAIAGRAPQIYLNELNASSVDWVCRVWCRPSEYMAVKERVTEAAKMALDENGIGIPFPQLDLHVITPAVKQKLAA